MNPDIVGWAAAVILLMTISKQVYKQWREGTCQGVSRWLFIGQITASLGFVIYSWLLKNWIFVFTNSVLLITAVVGQYIFLQNKKHKDKAETSIHS